MGTDREELLKQINKELDEAREAQETGKIPRMPVTADLFYSGEVDKIPSVELFLLGIILSGGHQPKIARPGKPSNEIYDIITVEEYEKIRSLGHSSADTYAILGRFRGYKGDADNIKRTVKRAIARGKKRIQEKSDRKARLRSTIKTKGG